MNWLDLFNSDPRNRKPQQHSFQDFGRFVESNAFGGNQTRQGQQRQEDFQEGFGGNPRPRRNYQEDGEWIYPQTSEGQGGDVRVRESAGANGVLQTDDGKALFVQKKVKRDDGTYRWEDVKSTEEAQDLLAPYVSRGGSDQQQQTQQKQQQTEPQERDRGERFEQVSYQPRGARTQDPKVEEVQRTLNQLGYNVDPDGYYGDQTKQAVARFMQDARSDPETRALVPSPEQNDGSTVNSILFNLMRRRAAGPSPYGGRR